MTREEKVNEIISQMTAFTKSTYSKEDFLPELFKLQNEIVELTFDPSVTNNGQMRLWDVEKHLDDLNTMHGNIADEELEKFKQGNKVINNDIKGLISGNRGEQMVFRELENLRCQNGILHNVEIEFDGRRTEIDTIVITNQAVFIIEIKNSKKNVYINEEGDFYRIGNNMHYDGNIADKMYEREVILRRAFSRAGFDYIKIFRIVTFTNARIDVENKYRYLKVCPFTYLKTFIEKFTSNQWYSYEDISTMIDAIDEIRCTNGYKMSIDMDDYRTNFASLMSKLEEAKNTDNETSEVELPTEEPVKPSQNHFELGSNESKDSKYAKSIAAAFGITLVNVAVIGLVKLIRK